MKQAGRTGNLDGQTQEADFTYMKNAFRTLNLLVSANKDSAYTLECPSSQEFATRSQWTKTLHDPKLHPTAFGPKVLIVQK